ADVRRFRQRLRSGGRAAAHAELGAHGFNRRPALAPQRAEIASRQRRLRTALGQRLGLLLEAADDPIDFVFGVAELLVQLVVEAALHDGFALGEPRLAREQVAALGVERRAVRVDRLPARL